MPYQQVKESMLEFFEKKFENRLDIMTKPDIGGDRIEVNGEWYHIKYFISTALDSARTATIAEMREKVPGEMESCECDCERVDSIGFNSCRTEFLKSLEEMEK